MNTIPTRSWILCLMGLLGAGLVIPPVHASVPEPPLILYGKLTNSDGLEVMGDEVRFDFLPEEDGDTVSIVTRTARVTEDVNLYVEVPVENLAVSLEDAGDLLIDRTKTLLLGAQYQVRIFYINRRISASHVPSLFTVQPAVVIGPIQYIRRQPVDTDYDLEISLAELLSGAHNWKGGADSPTVLELIQAGSIWIAGGGYHEDEDGNFVPDTPTGKIPGGKLNGDAVLLDQVAALMRDAYRGNEAELMNSLAGKGVGLTQLMQAIGGAPLQASMFLSSELQAKNVSAVRSLPNPSAGAQPFTVRIAVSVQDRPDVVAIEEVVPAGYAVTNINNGGVFNPATSTIRWFLMSGYDTTLAYEVVPQDGDGDFHGTVVWAVNGAEDSGFISGDSAWETPVESWMEY